LCVGDVHVFLKDFIFEASCPTRYIAELGRLMKEKYSDTIAVIMYTDVGPNHNCKHTSKRLGLLALFWELDMDTMVVMRTAPTHRWDNPVVRVMSQLNLGLQGVAPARDELEDEVHEKDFKKCNGMGAVRNATKACEMSEDPNDGEKEHQIRPLLHQHGEELIMLLQEEKVHRRRLQEEEHQSPLHAYEEAENAHHLHFEDLCLKEKEHLGAYDIDITGWDDEEVDHEEHYGAQDVHANVDAHTNTLEKPNRNPFAESYMKHPIGKGYNPWPNE